MMIKKITCLTIVIVGLLINVKAVALSIENSAKVLKVAEEGLRVGDVAPPLKVRFVKGNPTTEYKKGMVYVLEFWATWCVPCKKMMPHVSELAKKHAGKATFIGVSVWERPKTDQKIEQLVDDFVKENTAIMDYNVCMDTDGYVAKNFLDSAALIGIPATLIINQQGRVAWIGHPQSMDVPLQQIIDGSFDMAAFKVKMDIVQQREFDLKKHGDALTAAIKPVTDGAAAKDYPLVVSSYENLMAKYSNLLVDGYRDYLISLYYTALVNINPEKAYQDAINLPDTTAAYGIARAFASVDGLDQKFYSHAIGYFKDKKASGYDVALLASLNFHLGNAAKAVELQQQWIDSIKGPNARPQMARNLAVAEEALAKYKAAVK